MKKTIIILALLISLLFSTQIVFASESDILQTTSVDTRASTVFRSTTSIIYKSYFGGNATFLGECDGAIKITLQKQITTTTMTVWVTCDSQVYTQYFTNATACAYSEDYTLPAGTYRCKTIVTATLDGVTETRTVYSPELTVY